MSTPTPPTVELHAGGLRLALRPDLGGSIAGLWHHHVPVMRSTEPNELQSARLSACYPLLPYSNRIGYRRFRWRGQDYTTLPNSEGSPHSLHGVGWMESWSVESMSTVEVVIALKHVPDGHWPFAFEARQYFTLTPAALRVQTVFTNTDTRIQPVGLGWHPYFDRHTRSRLHIEIAQRWDPDPAGLPVRAVAQPGIDSDVSHLDFDHCFDGWRGKARIRDERFSLQLGSSLDRLVVYTPQNKAYFCVEPVSHVSNAIHMADPLAHGLLALGPGAQADAWMQLDVAVV
jgi:aldose 1-epimerase